MGILGDIASKVTSDLSWKAQQEVSEGISGGVSKIFSKKNPGAGKCPKCKSKITPDLKFCQKCGAKLTVSCAKCNTEYPIGVKFCAQCGGSLK